MADAVYWDTSALLKTYALEADSTQFLQLLLEQREAIAISYLHRVELYYGLSGKEQRGEIKPGSARTLFELFESHLAEDRYFEIPWGLDVVEQSHQVLDQNRATDPPVALRTLDGLHLGALKAARVSKLVTADRRMKEAAEKFGIRCIEP
jgi:predicted nucleic acid-binding protein